MGTVFTIDIRDPGAWDAAVAAVVVWLQRVDAVFSTYRADSVVSRLDRGEIALDDPAAKYLTEFNLDPRVTVAHLMHNTSGIRDMLEIAASLARTLAAAQAENGQFAEAIATCRRGEELARKNGDRAMAESLRDCMESFRRGEALRGTQVSH